MCTESLQIKVVIKSWQIYVYHADLWSNQYLSDLDFRDISFRDIWFPIDG